MHTDPRAPRLALVCRNFQFCVQLARETASAELRAGVRRSAPRVTGCSTQEALQTKRARDRIWERWMSARWAVVAPVNDLDYALEPLSMRRPEYYRLLLAARRSD